MEMDTKTRLLALASDADEAKNHLVVFRDMYWMGNFQDVTVFLMKATLREVVDKLLPFACYDAQINVFTLTSAQPVPLENADWSRAEERIRGAGGMILKNVYNFSPSLFTPEEHLDQFFKLIRTSPPDKQSHTLSLLAQRLLREVNSLTVKEEVGAPCVLEQSSNPNSPQTS